MFTLADFFTRYPYVEDPDFREKISRKVEFHELEAPLNESRPARGELYKHQLYTIRFMDNYPRLLCIHEPGTGKSCIIVGSAEMFKREYLKDPTDPTRVRRAIILIKNNKLKQNIRDEIVRVCAPGVYNPNGEAVNDISVTKAIHKWYDILSYNDFSNIIKSLTQEGVDAYLRNKVIYVDEAHNLIPGVLKQLEGEDEEGGSNARKQNRTAIKIDYDLFYSCFHNKRIRGVYLFTATPMIDNSRQFTPIINYIMPQDKTLDLKFDLTSLPDKKLDDFFRKNLSSNISFVKAVNNDIEAEVMVNPDLPLPDPTIYGVPMGDYQAKIYAKEYFPNHGKLGPSFSQRERTISDITLPTTMDRFLHDPNIQRRVYENIDDYGPKLGKVVQLANENYNNRDFTKRGVTFMFSPHYVASIVGPLRVFLKQAGFEEFNEIASNPERISYRKRFVVLTGASGDLLFRNAYDILKSPRNMFGDLISLVIGSKSVQEGISINNVSRLIMISSPWNSGSYIQAYNRVFRATSHTDKVRYLRSTVNEYFPGGPPTKSAQLGPTEKLKIEVYNMAAIFNKDDPDTSIDYRFYMISATKEDGINRLLDRCKEYAVDAVSHSRRNLGEEPPYSHRALDWTTKLQKYSQKEIGIVIAGIMKMFQQRSVISLDELYAKNGKIQREIISLSVEFLVSNAVMIKDKWGYPSVVRATKTNDIYLDRYNLRQTDSLMPFYVQGIDINQDLSMNYLLEYNKSKIFDEQDAILRPILDPDTPLNASSITNINPITVPILIEHVLSEVMQTRSMSDKQAEILDYFTHFIYVVPRRQNELRRIKEGDFKKIGRGRPPTDIEVMQVKQLDLTAGGDDQGYVLMHTLGLDGTKTNYDENKIISQGSKQQRIYDYNRNTWYTSSGAEAEIYRTIILHYNDKIMNPLKMNQYFAILIKKRNMFKIVNNQKNLLKAGSDKRTTYTGKDCGTWHSNALLDIVRTYGIIDGMTRSNQMDVDTLPWKAADDETATYVGNMENYAQRYALQDSFNKVIAQVPNPQAITMFDIYLALEQAWKGHSLAAICVGLREYFIRNNLVYFGNDVSLENLMKAAEIYEVDISEKAQIDNASQIGFGDNLDFDGVGVIEGFDDDDDFDF